MTNKKLGYKSEFYERYKDESYRSAKKIIPFVLELIKVKSVVDVGCGAGVWLKAFEEAGIKNILGIDGNSTKVLDISASKFKIVDLESDFKIARRFDLAISLEVAEHLYPEYADNFVLNLTKLAPIVLFSAAVPCQGGTRHVNEQWPDYWAEKFKKNGFLTFDVLRMKIWNDQEIGCLYRQNTIIYVQKDFVKKILKISKLKPVEKPPRLFHPEGFRIKILIHMIIKQLKRRMGFVQIDWLN